MSKNWPAEHVAELTANFRNMSDADWALKFGLTRMAVQSKRVSLGLHRQPDLVESQAAAKAKRALMQGSVALTSESVAVPHIYNPHHAVRISGGVTIAHGCVNPLTGRLSWQAMQQAMGGQR